MYSFLVWRVTARLLSRKICASHKIIFACKYRCYLLIVLLNTLLIQKFYDAKVLYQNESLKMFLYYLNSANYKYVYDIESKWPWIIEGFHGIDFFLFKFLQTTLFLQDNKQFQCKMMLLDLISKNKENYLEIKCYLQGKKMIIICRKDLKDIQRGKREKPCRRKRE